MPTLPRLFVWRLENLVHLVTSGRVRIPPFQRPFVWDVRHVIAVFRSVSQGLPVGTVFVVSQPAPAELVRVGPLEVAAPAMDDALWLVDGQQRIAALAGALMADDVVDDERFRIFYDLDDNAFRSSPPGVELPATWLPVNRLLDDAAFMRWYRERDTVLTAAQLDEAGSLADTFRSYQLPVYELAGSDRPELASEIFQRLNTAGVSLSAAEIKNARLPREGGSLLKSARLIGRSGFGGITDAQMRGYLRSTGLGLNDLTAGVRDAIRFLRAEAGVRHFTLLPDDSAIPALAVFVHRYGYPDARLAQLLRRWLWRRFVTHGDARPTLSVRMRNALADDPYETLAALLADTSDAPVPVPRSILDYDPESGIVPSSLGLLGVLSAEPVDITTGEAVDAVGSMSRRQMPLFHIFAVAGLGLPNTIVSDVEPPADLIQRLTLANAETLAGHLIDDVALDALAAGDRDEFLSHRRERIIEATQRLVDTMAEWGARGGRTMADLMRTVA